MARQVTIMMLKVSAQIIQNIHCFEGVIEILLQMQVI